jgi:DNA end-binding protein Ku
MAPRPNWKGHLKLSLVSCPVQLFTATTTKERVSFHLLNRETGNRLRRRLVDPETEDTVESGDQVKGYQVGKNEYILIEEEDLDRVAVESTHTIDIETFVPRAEIDELYLETPYYLVPDGDLAEEAFAVIREAMNAKKVVGIGRIVLYRRERPIMLEPRGKGLVASTLRYAYEVRDDQDYFDEIDDVKVSEEMLDLATHIIQRKAGHFDPKQFDDRYQDALLDLIKAKQAHRVISEAPAVPRPTNVVSLMDALRKSIANDPGSRGGKGGGATAKPAKAAKAPKEPAKPSKADTAKGKAPAKKAGAGRLKKAS